MKIGVFDIVILAAGFLALDMGYRTEVHALTFLGGMWVGVFLFKLSCLLEQRWRKTP